MFAEGTRVATTPTPPWALTGGRFAALRTGKFRWVAVAVDAPGVVQFHDLGATNRIDPLWLWNRSTP